MTQEFPIGRLKRQIHKATYYFTHLNKFVITLATVAIPIVLAFLSVVRDTMPVYVFVVLLVFLISTNGVIALIQKSAPNASDFIFKYERSRRNLEEEKAKSTLFATVITYSQSIMSMSLEHVSQGATSPSSRNVVIQDFLELLAGSEEGIFDFGKNELYSFAVYLYDSQTQMLDCCARKKHPDHPSTSSLGRSWRPGQGHVGSVYSNGHPITIGDAASTTARAALGTPPAAVQQYDAKVYRSVAGAPIIRQNGTVLGVVMATSDVPERYDELNGQALRHLATAIAVIL